MYSLYKIIDNQSIEHLESKRCRKCLFDIIKAETGVQVLTGVKQSDGSTHYTANGHTYKIVRLKNHDH